MGKKKPFIDKKKSTTYNLVYRSTEDADDAPERVFVETERQVGVGRPVEASETDAKELRDQAKIQNGESLRKYPPGHPLSWLEEEAVMEEISEQRRKELIELGFPDDGYDYLKHLRTLGRGTANLEGMNESEKLVKESTKVTMTASSADSLAVSAAGPSIFVTAGGINLPEEDRALYDASQLTVIQAVEKEEETEGLMGGVSAFAKRRNNDDVRMAKAHLTELEELEAAMRDAEELMEDENNANIPKVVIEDLDKEVRGIGDLLDDFVLGATKMNQESLVDQVSEEQDDDSVNHPKDSGWSSEDVESDDGSHDWVHDLGPEFRSVRPKPGSIASTYWREERSDRKKLLSVIDEHFEHLALEYDEDEIGDMEEHADEIKGGVDVEQFDAMMNEFLAARSKLQSESGLDNASGDKENSTLETKEIHSQLKDQLEAAGFDDEDAAVSIAAARAAIQREEDRAKMDSKDQTASQNDEDWCFVSAPTREQWDCESVLSLRSNLYNHPGTITEPNKWENPSRIIRLNKAGIPRGVLPTKGSLITRENDKSTVTNKILENRSNPGDGDKELVIEPIPVIMERKKGETAEEKKLRKASVKAAKREARMSKKELKMMYKQEDNKAKRRNATAQVQSAIIL